MRIHRHRVRKPKIQIPPFKVNDQIKAPELHVIDENKVSIGVMSREDALKLALEREMDLVEVFPKAEPPVAKLLNYGAFKYQKEKEIRKQKAQSKEVEVKGVRLSVRISDHDLDVRFQQGKKFLERGDKVRVEIVLRGREKAHTDIAEEVVYRYIDMLKAAYPIRLEQALSKQGGRVTAVVARE